MAKVKSKTNAHHTPGFVPEESVVDKLSLPSAKPVNVLVVGEVILDRYVWGEVSRISPEAPIPILHVHRREERAGNAAFVMANLRSLGADVHALSVIGQDSEGRRLQRLLKTWGINTDGIVASSKRPTIVKERFLGSVQSAGRAIQQLLRVDNEDTRTIPPTLERELIKKARAKLPSVQAVLVSDINKGLLTPQLLRAVIEGGRERGIPVVIDPRLSADYSIYRGATVLTPNRFETETATGVAMTNPEAWRKAGEFLLDKLGLEACLITLDRDGMYLCQREGAGLHIPTTPREVYDVTGAGDVVLAVFGLMVALKENFVRAAALSNIAAGIEVSHLGAHVISRDELEEGIKSRLASPHTLQDRKIVSIPELKRHLEKERSRGHRIVFTNGCFDLLHAGHVASLNFARAQGDCLVVGLNSDSSVRRLKGDSRPVYSAMERARMLAALESVDYVVIFDDLKAERIIREVEPDVLVKGEDYRGQTVDGAEFVLARGGQVVFAPLLAGRSTSQTISSIVQQSPK